MKKVIISFLVLTTTLYLLIGQTLHNISQENFEKIEKKYGEKAAKRVIVWDNMIESIKNEKEVVKLKTINDFFNQITYMSDEKVWKKKDYWASPFEFLGVGAGDCEDYAIAKYFALRAVGIEDEKLKITYVKLKSKNKNFEEAHMVLNYYHKPTSTPVVLDNVDKSLKLASKRDDLKPVYSFNASGLWEAQNKTNDLKKQGENTLDNWKSMMSRI